LHLKKRSQILWFCKRCARFSVVYRNSRGSCARDWRV